MTQRRSNIWTVALRLFYAVLGVLDPLVRWAWFSVGIGITAKLTVRGRHTGRARSVLVGLLRVDSSWYVGHPNGEVGWTANLREARRGLIAPRPEESFECTAVSIDDGPERTAVILATAEQQPFPGNLMYRAARRHILSVGRYFRLEPA